MADTSNFSDISLADAMKSTGDRQTPAPMEQTSGPEALRASLDVNFWKRPNLYLEPLVQEYWPGLQDQNYIPSRQQMEKDVYDPANGFPDDIQGQLSDDLINARSKQHYDAILYKYQEVTRARRVVAGAGTNGVISALVANSLSPENFLPFMAASRVGAAARAAYLAEDVANTVNWGVRLRGAMAGAGTAMAVNAPFAATRTALDPYSNANDFVNDMATTAFFGALSGLAPHGRDAYVADALNDVRKQAAKQATRQAVGATGVAIESSLPDYRSAVAENIRAKGEQVAPVADLVEKLPKWAVGRMVELEQNPEILSKQGSIHPDFQNMGGAFLAGDEQKASRIIYGEQTGLPTLAHELGHSVYDSLPENVKAQFKARIGDLSLADLYHGDNPEAAQAIKNYETSRGPGVVADEAFALGFMEWAANKSDKFKIADGLDRLKVTPQISKLVDDILGKTDLVFGPESPKESINVGDEIHWVSSGSQQFESPKVVTGISDDGSHVFVQGSKTGIPVAEAVKVPLDGAPNVNQIKEPEILEPHGPNNGIRNPILTDSDLKDVPKSRFNRWWSRFSNVARLDRSNSELVRQANYALVHDPVPRIGEKPSPEAMQEWVQRYVDATQADIHASADAAFKDFAERFPKKDVNQADLRKFFNEQVSEALRRKAGEFTPDQAINAAADKMRNIFKRQLELMQRFGVPGWEDIAADPTYLPRLWKLANIDQAKVRFGMDALNELFTEATLRGAAKNGKQLTREEAQQLGKLRLQKLIIEKQMSGVDERSFFSMATPADLLAQAKRFGIDMTDEQSKQLAELFGEDKGASKSARAKPRMDIDETTSIKVTDKDGNPIGTLAIKDLVENDAVKLADHYTRHTFGLAAERYFLDRMESITGTRYTNFDSFINEIIQKHAEDGSLTTNKSANRLNREIKTLRYMADYVFGRAPKPDAGLDQFSRAVRDANYLRVMSMIGFTQIPEFIGAVAEHGLEAMQKSMPQLDGIFKRGADGKLENTLMRELEGLGGFGTSHMRAQGIHRMEEIEGAADQASNVLSKSRDLMAKYTGFNFIDSLEQKMTALLWTNKIAAEGGEQTKLRLLEAGLTPEMADRIKGQIAEHGNRGSQGELAAINIDDWKDQEAASHFAVALNRTVRRLIQQVGPGDVNPLMAGGEFDWLKKMFFQFKTFSVVAMEKQGYYGMAVKDRQAFQNMMSNILVGSLIIYGKRYANSLGYEGDERDKYVQRNMSTSAIARSAVANTAHLAFLANSIDTVSESLGLGSLFTGGAGNPLDHNFVTNSMAYDLFADTLKATKSLRDVYDPTRHITRGDYRNWTSLAPLSNALFLNQTLNRIGNALPRRQSE